MADERRCRCGQLADTTHTHAGADPMRHTTFPGGGAGNMQPMVDPYAAGKFWIEVGAFADRLMGYLAERNTPWKDEAEMNEAVRQTCRLIFGDARDDTRRLVERMV